MPSLSPAHWFFGAVALLLLPLLVLRWAAGSLAPRNSIQGETVSVSSENFERDSSTLRVMTWNIAFVRGTNPDVNTNTPDTPEVIARRIERMGELIRQQRADIVFVQEVDFFATRSHDQDQLSALAKASGLPHIARVVSWDARYVPFPYWPPSAHYGRVKSGGGVLSRFPILRNEAHLLPRPANNPWWYNLFYLARYSQWVEMDIHGERIWIVNNHLEAFDRANRELHAELIGKLFRENSERNVIVIGGDLNTVPPEAPRKHGFPDAPDDYRNDGTLERFRNLPELREGITPEEYLRDEKNYFTYPALEPTRRIDHLFISKRWNVRSYHVVPINDFSDHRPVIVEINR